MLTFIYRFIEGYLKNICEQRNNIFLLQIQRITFV